MFQLPTEDAGGGRRRTSKAALEVAVNAQLDQVKGSAGHGQILHVPDGTDAAPLINAKLEEMEATGGILYVRRANLADPVYLDRRVQVYGSGITLEFLSPVLIGPGGSMRIKGDLDEFWRGAPAEGGGRVENTGGIPAVEVDSTDDPVSGNLVLTLSATDDDYIGQFEVGDMVVVRGYISARRLASIEKMFAFVAAIDSEARTLTLDRPRGVHTSADDASEMGKSLGDPFVFARRYYPPGTPQTPDNELQSPTGEGVMSTRIKVLRTSVLLADKQPGGFEIEVADGSIFSVGDLVYISDDRREIDIAPERPGFFSRINMEIMHICAISGNVLTFEAQTRRQYLTAYGARVTRLKPVRRSHIRVGDMRYGAVQINRNFYGIQIDYGAFCTARVNYMEGRAGRIAQAVRISNSYDCHLRNSTIDGVFRFGSGEGYGCTLYYSTSCTVQNCTILDCRHSVLFQGTTACEAIGNRSMGDRITAIDTHGTWCIASRILHNYIRGGILNTGDASRHTGVRVGNSSHIVPDTDTLVQGNFIEGYGGPDDAGLDVVPPVEGANFIGNVVQDCTVGIRASGNSSSVLEFPVLGEVLAQGNTFIRCQKAVDFTGAASRRISTVKLIGNTFRGCGQHVVARNFEVGGSVLATGNVAMEPVDPAKPMFDLTGIPGTRITGGNVAPALGTAVLLADCPGASITGNDFSRCTRAVLASGDQNGVIDMGNGLTGGPRGALLQQVRGTLPASWTSTVQVPHNNSLPALIAGAEIVVAAIETRLGEVIEVEGVIPYMQITGPTGPVTAALFQDGAALDCVTDRLTNGGSSGGPMRLGGVFTAPGGPITITLQAGPSAEGIAVVLNAKFGDLGQPYLIIRRSAA